MCFDETDAVSSTDAFLANSRRRPRSPDVLAPTSMELESRVEEFMRTVEAAWDALAVDIFRFQRDKQGSGNETQETICDMVRTGDLHIQEGIECIRFGAKEILYAMEDA